MDPKVVDSALQTLQDHAHLFQLEQIRIEEAIISAARKEDPRMTPALERAIRVVVQRIRLADQVPVLCSLAREMGVSLRMSMDLVSEVTGLGYITVRRIMERSKA